MRRDYLEEQLEQTRPPEPAKPPEEPADALHELQSGAGNRAMTALLQRDALSMRDPPPLGLGGAPPLAGGIDLAYIERHQREVKEKIRAYLDGDREKIQGQISVGASMAELIDRVRTNVPDSHELAPEQIAEVLRAWSPITIAEHRAPGDVKGAESELIATARNAFSKIPTSVKLERKGAFVELSLGGLEAGLERDEEHKVSVASESGRDVGVNIVSGPVHFAAKVEPGEAGGPAKWEMGLTFPGDDPVPLVGALGGVFGAANSSLGKLASDLRAGKTDVGKVKAQWAPVKEATEAVKGILGHSGVSASIKVEGEGGAIAVTASLTVTF
jgi:hypothetical protein